LKNLVQRTVSGIVYLIIIIGSLFLGKYGFGAVFLLAGILALLEFYELNGIPGTTTVPILGIAAAAVIFILSFLVTAQMGESRLLTVVLSLPVLLFIAALYSSVSDPVKSLGIVFLGIVYVVIPLAAMNYLVFPAVNDHMYTHRIVLGILSLVWINDTGAYVAGTLLGRHRLFPRISPKKSWEGLAGGTILTMATAWWMTDIMGILSQTDWIILGAVASVFGVYGDLAESLIKRKADRKDSGALIPGHGGVLDRIDSILFVMPVSFLYLMIKGL
jgi:phosphatidate cytidylyltransferase